MTAILFLDGGGPVTCDYLDSSGSDTFQTTHSFSMPAGDPVSNRVIAVVVNYRVAGSQNGPISALTIGGVDAYPPLREDALVFSDILAESRVAIFAAMVDTVASTVTVAITAGADIAVEVSIYRIANLISLTAVDTAGGIVNGTSLTVNLDTPDGGVLLAGAGCNNVSTPQFTAGVTQDTTGLDVNTAPVIAGHHLTSTESNRAVTITRVGGSASMNAVVTAVSLR